MNSVSATRAKSHDKATKQQPAPPLKLAVPTEEDLIWEPANGSEGFIRVPVAHTSYRLFLTKGPVIWKGDNIRGICDAHQRYILISGEHDPANRWAEFLHELAHVIDFELDLSAEKCTLEVFTKMMAFGLGPLTIGELTSIHSYLMQEGAADIQRRIA